MVQTDSLLFFACIECNYFLSKKWTVHVALKNLTGRCVCYTNIWKLLTTGKFCSRSFITFVIVVLLLFLRNNNVGNVLLSRLLVQDTLENEHGQCGLCFTLTRIDRKLTDKARKLYNTYPINVIYGCLERRRMLFIWKQNGLVLGKRKSAWCLSGVEEGTRYLWHVPVVVTLPAEQKFDIWTEKRVSRNSICKPK